MQEHESLCSLHREPGADVPQIEAVEPAGGGTLLHGITKMIVPSIMQCSKGGYIVVIPGVGLMAASSMNEVMAFVEQHANVHFRDGGIITEFPKVMQRAAGRFGSSFMRQAKRVDMVGGTVLVIGVLAAWLFFIAPAGDYPYDQRQHKTTTHSLYFSPVRETERPPLRSDSGGRESPRPGREGVLPEVYVREVRTTPYDGRP